MDALISIICIFAVLMIACTPFIVVGEIKKQCGKDKNYKLFRIKQKQLELKQQLQNLEREIRDFEDSFPLDGCEQNEDCE